MAAVQVSPNMIFQTPGFRRFFTLIFLFACIFFLCGATAKPGSSKYPIRISEDGRHFEEQNGRPFFVHGDSAWSLIAQLNLQETQFYLDHRRSQGFNAILVNLIERKFAKNPPHNALGDPPFFRPGNFSTPNEAYFAHADAVIRMAASKGMLVFLVPAYLGWKGGDDGWFQDIRRAGAEMLRNYGRFIGNRYKSFPNIVWVMGGDFTPPRLYRWSVDALAEGIREGGAAQLMTAHCGQESPANVFGNRKWLDFSNVYSYVRNLHVETLREYNRQPVKPFILIESIYENEHHVTSDRIRQQAYWSVLTGAAGHFYGNNPVWNFGSPEKVFPAEQSWREALNSMGAKDMSRLQAQFGKMQWYTLVPDTENRFLVAGYGQKASERYSTAAVTRDGKDVIVYVASEAPRKLSINLTKCLPNCKTFWVDPTNGKTINITEFNDLGMGRKEVETPGKNNSGAKDWLLYLKAE
jgi:hypothetical protein